MADSVGLYDQVIFGNLGEFGLFQFIIYITCNLAETPAAWAMTMMSIAAVVPDWWSYEAINPTSNNITGSGLFLNGTNYSSYINLQPTQWKPMYQVCPTGINKTIVFDSNAVSIISEWNLVCDRDWIPNTITTVQMVGVLLGAFLSGQMGDYFGRKKTFFIVYATVLLFTFVSAFSTSWQMFAVFRFLIGLGLGGFLILSFNLPLEYIGTSWRTIGSACPFWALGICLLAFFAWLNDNWKTLSIGISCAGSLLLFSWWYLPESVRWLLTHNRIEEAENILKKMARINKRPIPDLSKVKALQEAEIELAAEAVSYSYLDLFKHVYLIKRVGILGLCWFTFTLTYYGLTFSVSSLAGSRYLNMFLFGILEAVAVVSIIFTSKRIGRKMTTILFLVLTAACAIGVVISLMASSSNKATGLSSGLAIASRCFLSAAWASGMLFTAENFPTVVRTIGYAACSIAGRVGGVIAPQIIFLNKFGVFIPYLVYGVFLTLSCLGCLMLVNTYDDPLPDFIGDGCETTTTKDGNVLKLIPNEQDDKMA